MRVRARHPTGWVRHPDLVSSTELVARAVLALVLTAALLAGAVVLAAIEWWLVAPPLLAAGVALRYGSLALARRCAAARRRRLAAVGRRDELIGTPSGGRATLSLLASAVLLAGVGVLALPGEPKEALSTLPRAVQDPALLVPLGAIVTIALAASLRVFTYRLLLQQPGPIQILALEDATATISEAGGTTGTTGTTGAPGAPIAPGAPVVPGMIGILDPPGTLGTPGTLGPRHSQLDLHFRQRLSEAKLSAPIPTPGSRASTDIVELLETSDIDAKKPFAAIAALLRIVRPTHGYEVRPTLVAREEAPGCGVVTEVVVLPHRRTTLQTYWEMTWEKALDRAATGVAAQVVPRSRHSDAGVWCSWKGFVLDERLFETYQRAQRLRAKRRYEEALDLLYEAVRLDPGNGYLRFAVGTVQEELTLYLDALLTYRAVFLNSPRRSAGAAAKAAERVALSARYRYTVLLGFGEGLAEQWLAAPADAPPSRRSDELQLLRARLRPVLIEHFERLELHPADLRRLRIHRNTGTGLQELLDERPHLDSTRPRELRGLAPSQRARIRNDNRRLRERRLQLLFQLLAEDSIDELIRTYDRRTVGKLETQLTMTSHELLASWSQLRTERARHLLRTEQRRQVLRERNRNVPSGTARKRRPAGPSDRWPPSAQEIRALWDGRGASGHTLAERLHGSRQFVDHFNAACIYAIALLPAPGSGTRSAEAREEADTRIKELSEAAVHELRLAAVVGGSSALAARWDAIAAEDPDLAGLRTTRAFQRFETDWLPTARPVPVRPSAIVRLNASRNSVELCRRCAGHIERVWRRRGEAEEPVTSDTLLAWWRDEEGAWRLAAELAQHHRHWQTRRRIMDEMQRFARRHGAPRFRSPHPAYVDDPIEGDPAAVDRLARHEIHFGDLRLSALASVLSSRAGRLPGFETWERYFGELDGAGRAIDAASLRMLCDDRASAWRELRDAFGARGTSEKDARARFELQFTEIADRLGALMPPSEHGERPRGDAVPARYRKLVAVDEVRHVEDSWIRSDSRRLIHPAGDSFVDSTAPSRI